MSIFVLDLDGVVQDPEDPHAKLIKDVSRIVRKPYEELFDHYARQFRDNDTEEMYHLSLCNTKEQKGEVRVRWSQLHENMDKVKPIPAAKELLEVLRSQGHKIYAFTKGKVEIQRRRLRRNGISEFFPQIVYSARKGTREGFERDLLPELPKGKPIVVVGDSFYQDIEPALSRENISCVWIHWPDSDEPVPESSKEGYSNLHIVKSTQEFADLVKKGAFDG